MPRAPAHSRRSGAGASCRLAGWSRGTMSGAADPALTAAGALRGRVGQHARLERRRRLDGFGRREANPDHDALHLLELRLAGGTRRQMRLERLLLGGVESPQRVSRHQVVELLVWRRHRHVASAVRRADMAARRRVFTVPRGTPVRSAISECVRPS